MASKNLPFELSKDSVANWLQSLNQLNSANSADQLNKVIQKIGSTKDGPDTILETLLQLTPTVLFVIATTESSLLSASNDEASKKSYKIEQLCIQLLRNLSLILCFNAARKTVSTEIQSQAIYFALQLIGHTQRIASIFHQSPSRTLWEKMGEIYLFAQEKNICHDDIQHEIRTFKNQSTIDAVLKRNFLFALLAPYQHNSCQVIELFSISDQRAHLLSLNTANSTDNMFFWDPYSGNHPCTSDNIKKASDFNITIDTTDFLSLIQSPAFSSSLEKETVDHIIAKLSGYKKTFSTFNSSKPHITHHIVTGFTEITNFLKKADKLIKIQQLSSEHKDALPVNTMSLELLEIEQNYLTPESDPTSSRNIDNLLTDYKTVEMWLLKDDQYIVAKIKTLNCSSNDLILFCGSSLNPELGIIRQIQVTGSSKTIYILIEKIAGTLSTHQIVSPETPENQIILIHNQNSQSEVFIAPCKLSNGTLITLSSEEDITLKKLIDFNPQYMHYLCK